MPSLSQNRPADYQDYWKATLDELASLPPAPEVGEIPLRSTEFASAYSVRLTSIGPYRIFAYLSIPRGPGPFPARLYLPRYGSVVELIPQGSANALREHYVICSIGVRGQRGADQPFAASFPGLLTTDIEDPLAYVFRGIVADCIRGLEYLVSRPEVDRGRVAAIGNDLALMTAALCPQITHVVCTPSLFYATSDLAPHTEAYPLEEINDYLRLYPSNLEAVHRTLSYFDLRWAPAPEYSPTLLIGGADGELLDREAFEPLLQTLGEWGEFRELEHSAFKDGLFTEEWLTKKLGLAKPVLPEHWQ
ncbi:MAG: hypothetical protein BZY88_03840 [SAR202 cluster bacterium Io17-Chloro-G9]|nr:MAG: hypothetical protein BZY88_03840 [SAR202 cluster bacterium Io17-Chloro-G9]